MKYYFQNTRENVICFDSNLLSMLEKSCLGSSVYILDLMKRTIIPLPFLYYYHFWNRIISYVFLFNIEWSDVSDCLIA